MNFNKFLKAVWGVLLLTAKIKKNPTDSRVSYNFFQKSIVLLCVKITKLNTYRKLRRVNSIVSRTLYYPAAILV